jgi:pyruvate kinase
MLSEETTLGDFPVESVQMMSRIASRVEKDVYTTDTIAEYEDSHGVTDVTSQSAVLASHEVEAKFIIAVTESGRTARMVARYRPAERIIAMTLTDATARKLCLSFGCYPIVVEKFTTISEVMNIVRKVALKEKIAIKGDKVIIVAGLPFGKMQETNMMLVETI